MKVLQGFVNRNAKGDPILARARAFGRHISVLQVEDWVLKKGILTTLSLNIVNLVIEGDNLVTNSICKVWKVS